MKDNVPVLLLAGLVVWLVVERGQVEEHEPQPISEPTVTAAEPDVDDRIIDLEAEIGRMQADGLDEQQAEAHEPVARPVAAPQQTTQRKRLFWRWRR